MATKVTAQAGESVDALIRKFNKKVQSEGILAEIEKDAKRHKESIDAFGKGGREELAEKEKAELAILTKYLPEQMPDSDLEKIVIEAIAASGAEGPGDMGKVMSAVMAEVRGKAD